MIEVTAPDGRTLRAYDVPVDDPVLTVVWHHGTPNVGTPPEPLLPASAARRIRWVSYDRPGYGGSTPHPGRDVASAAGDVEAIADALGLDRFAVLGHSGGGPHALACAALLPDRVVAAVSGSGLAPYPADGLDWFAGINPAGTAELRAAVEGRAALEQVLSASEYDPEMFTPTDHAALEGDWGWLGRIAGRGAGGRHRRDGRRRPRLRRALGLRPRDHHRARAPPARRRGPRGAQQPRALAGGPHPVGGALAAPRRRPRLGAGRRDRRPRLAALESRRPGG